MSRIERSVVFGRSLAVLAAVTLSSACGGDEARRPETAAGMGGGNPSQAGDGGTASSEGGTGGTGTSGAGAGGKSGTAGKAGSGGRPAGSGGRPEAGSPTSCEDDDLAFCDTFDAKTSTPGPRTGDLDPARWSVGRISPQLPTGSPSVISIPAATIPACRSGVGTSVFPNEDMLICDANDQIGSAHVLMAVAAQNYGQNSQRIRQPFDFAGRTGKVVFDMEAYAENTLLGWAAIEISEDPTPTPSFPDFEYGPLPRNGLQIQFTPCDPYEGVGVREVRTFKDFVKTGIEPTFSDLQACPTAEKGKLNHIELRLSKTSLEVYASDVSPDGSSYPNFRLIYTADIDLPFERGYVTLTGHNHATLKYSDHAIDAWLVRWDNVGFDGPVVSNHREYSLPDSLTPINNGERVNIGYKVPADEGAPAVLEFSDVDPSDVESAKLAFTVYYPACYNEAECLAYNVRYRVNGGAYHDRIPDAGELGVMLLANQQGCLNQVIELDPSELVAGTNTIELAAPTIPQSYPPAVANVDLVLTTR